MKNVLLVIIALLLVSPAMAKRAKKKKNVVDQIASVEVHHGTCFGRCPDYALKVDRNGLLTYTGFRFVDDTGVYQKNINKAVANKLLDEYSNYRIDTCQELYENRIPDLPQLYYTITFNKKAVKKIYCANWGPKYLTTMADKMDKIGKKTDSVGWKRVGGVPKGQGN